MSHRVNILREEIYDFHNTKKKIYRSSGERRRTRSRSRSQRKQRRYRGSSGTRANKRSHDRDIRLKQYYSKRQKRGDSYKCHTSSRRGRKHHESSSRSRSLSSSSRGRHQVRDDKDGHLIYRAGDWLQNRCTKIKLCKMSDEIWSLLGEGTFGKCLECYDRKHNQTIALKIVKNVESYREAAKLELKVLDKLSRKDPDGKYLCIKLLGAFEYHGHVCLAFPKLGKSVFDFLKDNMYQPYPMHQVQHIAFQLLTSIKFLHSLKLTHTDLKPENMLFEDSTYDTVWNESARQDVKVLRSSEMRLIDFGSATFDHEHHSTVVSTRHYRAPEVVLELGWSQPCDIWSCGCIIFEIYTGSNLYLTHDNREHLAMMERTLGKLPSHMIKKSSKTRYFRKGTLDWDVSSSDGRYVKDNCKPLKDHLTSGRSQHLELYDLLTKLLTYEPSDRITSRVALEHPFFTSIQRS